MDIRHIIVASDMSEHARASYQYAAAFAGELRARVTLLHAIEGNDAVSRAVEGPARQLEADLDAMGLRFQRVDKRGDPTEVIGEWLHEPWGMIVMANRSAPELRHKRLGSTTRAALRATTIPILVAPSEPGHEMAHLGRMLAPTDLRDAGRRGLNATLALAKRFNTHVMGAYVVQGPALPMTTREGRVVLTRAELTAVPEDYEQGLLVQMQEEGYRRIGAGFGGADRTADALLTLADAVDAAIIAIPATGKGGVARFFLGSTTESLVRQTRGPGILVMPPAFLKGYDGLPPEQPEVG